VATFVVLADVDALAVGTAAVGFVVHHLFCSLLSRTNQGSRSKVPEQPELCFARPPRNIGDWRRPVNHRMAQFGLGTLRK
jgi:hypothetical protein